MCARVCCAFALKLYAPAPRDRSHRSAGAPAHSGSAFHRPRCPPPPYQPPPPSSHGCAHSPGCVCVCVLCAYVCFLVTHQDEISEQSHKAKQGGKRKVLNTKLGYTHIPLYNGYANAHTHRHIQSLVQKVHIRTHTIPPPSFSHYQTHSAQYHSAPFPSSMWECLRIFFIFFFSCTHTRAHICGTRSSSVSSKYKVFPEVSSDLISKKGALSVQHTLTTPILCRAIKRLYGFVSTTSALMCATLHTHKKSIGAFAVSVLNLGYRTHECYPAHAQKKQWSICSLCAQFGLPHPCVLPCTCTKKALEHLQSLCSIWLIPAPHLNVQTCSHLHMPCWLLVLCVGCVFVKLCPCAMSAQGSIHVMK